MGKFRWINRLLIVCLLALSLAGCELPRADDTEGDIEEPVPVVVPVEPPAQEEFTPPQVAQAGDAVILIQPADQQIEIGATTVTDVAVADVTNLVGADVEIRFDPTVLQVQDADPNVAGVQIQPGDFLAANFVVTNNVDNSTGIIRYAVTQLAPTPPVSGAGVLFRIPFQGIAQGFSQLAFSTVQLANSDFQEIPVTLETGQIVVGQVPVTLTPPTPTPIFPTPTLPPGVTPTPTLPPVITPTPTPLLPTPVPTLTPTPLFPTATPPPTATPVLANLPFDLPPGATAGFCYRVEPKENIFIIANKFGVTPEMINVVNDLYPPGHTFVHQVLFIPTFLGHGPNFYRIEAGDTLTAIADRCRLTVEVLARANKISPNEFIAAGQFLFIPIPPFPPPSRYPYPLPIVPVPDPCCKPSHP